MNDIADIPWSTNPRVDYSITNAINNVWSKKRVADFTIRESSSHSDEFLHNECV